MAGLIEQFILAAQEGKITEVQTLLERGADINGKDALGITPLYEAVASERTEIVKLLLELGANPNVSEKNGISPLMEAAAGGNSEIIMALLDGGADPNQKDNFGDDAANYAKNQGFDDVVRFLENVRK